MTLADETVLVLGGSGFVGRHVVNELVREGKRVVVPTRRRENARHLILLPTVDVINGDVHDPATLARLVAGASAVVNLVGILNESRRNTFARVHVELVRKIIAACHASGVRRLIHMSAQNADPAGPSVYLRSKGEAEAAIADSGLDWTIFRPSVIFGREDRFLNLFATLERHLPVMAIAAAQTRFAPVYVGDVAHCFAHTLAEDATIGERYPLCGPDVYTLRELVAFVGKLTEHERPIVSLPPALGRLQARILELLPGTPMSRDNLSSMERDSVCDGPFPAVFGIVPAALAAVAPTYLGPAAEKSRYDAYRSQVGR
jgi:uncharacterized protein YbjT (DUF2867 family)